MALINDPHGNIGCAMMIVAIGLAIGIIILSVGGCTALNRSYIQYSNHEVPE